MTKEMLIKLLDTLSDSQIEYIYELAKLLFGQSSD